MKSLLSPAIPPVLDLGEPTASSPRDQYPAHPRRAAEVEIGGQYVYSEQDNFALSTGIEGPGIDSHSSSIHSIGAEYQSHSDSNSAAGTAGGGHIHNSGHRVDICYITTKGYVVVRPKVTFARMPPIPVDVRSLRRVRGGTGMENALNFTRSQWAVEACNVAGEC